jgi:hypothetical protein
MNQSAFTERVQELHRAYFALRSQEDEEAQAVARLRYQRLVLDTAREMQAQGWGSYTYYTAYDDLLNSPNGRVIDLGKEEDDVVKGLEWVCFALGYDFRADMIDEDEDDEDEQ